MISALRPTLQAFSHFVRTPSVGRRVAAMMALAITLMLVLNLGVFVMIQRTAAFNQTVENTSEARRLGRTVLISMVDAETGQRGYLLTGQESFLQPYTEAVATVNDHLAELQAVTRGDPDLEGRVAVVEDLAGRKLAELARSVELARTGRGSSAIAILQSGEGRVVMEAMRTEIAAIDEIYGTRLIFGRRQTEWAGGLTVIVNAMGGMLILVLAGASALLIRRYVFEVQGARDALDRLNAGLEQQVQDRTSALTRANEEIQRFAYIVSHDLRAPLVNVMGYTSELEQAGQVIDRQMTAIQTGAPALVDQAAVTAIREDIPEAVGFIRASTEKMDRLINAILKLSREGRRNLVPELLDMTAMVRNIADSVRHQTQAGGAEIVVGTLPRLESDRLSLEQVLGNLIDNAVKYLDASRPGRIVVSGEEARDGWIVYRITDNGRGISDRDHERIFELFRRSGRQDRPGEGLGLAFVRNSVRRLGGDITVESELGKGSTFTLRFPTRLTLSDAGDPA